MSCVHHWRLDEPGEGRRFVHGRCTYCGEVRADFLVGERDDALIEFTTGRAPAYGSATRGGYAGGRAAKRRPAAS